MTDAGLSCVVLTLNSEVTLAKCLVSVGMLADEIVVVDGGSVDRTLEIAGSYECRILKSTSRDFSVLRNLGISAAKRDWILMLDSDEIVTARLADELRSLLRQPRFEVYAIPRLNLVSGRRLWVSARRTGAAYPDYHTDLFLKRPDRRYRRPIHELLFSGGKLALQLPHGKLKNPMIHLDRSLWNWREFLRIDDIFILAALDAQVARTPFRNSLAGFLFLILSFARLLKDDMRDIRSGNVRSYVDALVLLSDLIRSICYDLAYVTHSPRGAQDNTKSGDSHRTPSRDENSRNSAMWSAACVVLLLILCTSI